jgi:tetratricopeptide (TPR) repeat protein
MMPDLQRQLDELRRRLAALADQPDPVTLAEVERSARALLGDARNTPYEDAARQLFAEVAQLSSPANAAAAQLRTLLPRARIRLEMAGGDDDIDQAVDLLAEALMLDPAHEETLRLLDEAAAHNPQAARRVRDILARHGIRRPLNAPAARTGDQPRQTPPPAPPSAASSGQMPPPAAPRAAVEPPAAPEAPRPAAGPSDLDALLSEMTQAYYAGDYQMVVDLATRVLNQYPGNATALEYRQKAEDNIIRGVVPDHRIPFDARVSYNRANSLVRAGNYDEAERLYREARDIAERAGILSWKDAERALLDIQDLSLARRMIGDGDRALAADDWSGALEKYEGALRVVANDPQASERIDKVRRIQAEAESIAVQLSMLGGTLTEQVSTIGTLQAALARVRQLLPNSARLANLADQIAARASALKTQITEQARLALDRATASPSLDETIALSGEAVTLLEQALKLDPTDSSLNSALMSARAAASDAQRARQVIERAASLVAQNFDADLIQARSMLAGLMDYAQDSRYRTVVSDLLTRFVERAVAALEEGDIDEAAALMESAREEPFNILGRRAEIARVETQIRQMRQAARLRLAGAIGGGIVVLLLALLLTRPVWEPIVNPPPTATPTPTFTPSATFTPSDTPTPTETFTPTWTPSVTPTNTFTATPTFTPTATFTPSATFTPTDTPTATPTPLILCLVINVTGENRFVRAEPTTASTQIAVLPPARIANVIEQQRNAAGELWFRIEYTVDGSRIIGWTRADNVQQATECPDFPG